ncbi:DUF4080 domain-containing protein [Pseudomonadota bacterium]
MSPTHPHIVLSTLNARYIHSAFGLRYLKANLGDLADSTQIIEFTIHERPIDIVEKLLVDSPIIIGLGVYVWNIEEITHVAALIKTISPETVLVLGGPEVSFEHEQQAICNHADYIICGNGEQAFAELSQEIINGSRPTEKIIRTTPAKLEELLLPYKHYSDEDIAHRIIYVEASRGCPFKCEFCLSALDKTAWPFDIDLFLNEMDGLYKRGARHFKFVDRTFNMKIDNSIRIMEFFLKRLNDELFLHFEIIPDHLPDKLKETISRFPAGNLQFEVGVQSFNEKTQTLISRKQDNKKTEENLRWIRQQTQAHIHADLIIGLPGEDMHSFGAGFDRLVELNPHEIQVGILKRLRGSPIIRHTNEFDMRYNPLPPYNILSNNLIDFKTMQQLNRFARYWDMIANSGRFPNTLPILLESAPFNNFLKLSHWLFEATGQTHKINLKRLFALVYNGAIQTLDTDTTKLKTALNSDYLSSGLKGILDINDSSQTVQNRTKNTTASARQQRHKTS